MTKRVKRQIATLLLVTQLAFALFAPFAPLAHLIPQALANDDAETIADSKSFLSFLTEDSDHANQLVVKTNSNSSEAFPYALYYLHDQTAQAVHGELVANSENVLFIGTQSNEDFINHNWQKMVFKVQDGDVIRSYYLHKQVDGELVGNSFETDSLELLQEDTQWINWLTDAESKTATTVESVVESKEFVFPFNDKVSVKFNKLPEKTSPLTIRQVELSEEMAEKFGTDLAYDITTEMENGTFEFDLSLPKPESLENEGTKVEVVFADTEEDLLDEKKVSKVETEQEVTVDEEKGIVKVEGVEHMTVFVVTFEVPQDESPTNPGYNDVWFNFGGEINRVASGTNGIFSAGGDYHTEITGSVFTRYGEYRPVFPSLGYDTRIDVYLDMGLSDSSDKRFDYSSAISTPDNSHRRDFIFHLGTDPSSSGQWFVSVSNNAPGWPGNPDRSPVSINESGWYTLEHKFRKNDDNQLEVTLSIYKKGSLVPIGSWVLANPLDIIGDTVGGNRYGWFTSHRFDFDWLAIDNSEYSEVYTSLTPVTPTILGYAIQGIDAINSPSMTCGNYFDGSTNRSTVWTDVSASGSNVKYIRHNQRPNSNPDILLGQVGRIKLSNPDDSNVSSVIETLSDSYLNNYSGWGTFGSGIGEGLYRTRVRAFSDLNDNDKYDDGEPISDWSDWCDTTYDKTAPDAPKLNSPQNNSFVQGASLTSDWFDVEGAVKYLYESYHDEDTNNLRYRNEYSASQKTATNVADATFWWRVKAIDAAGNQSGWSDLWKVTVDNTSPAMPANLTRFSKDGSMEYQCNDVTTLQTLIPNWSDVSLDDPSFSHYEYSSFNVGGIIGIDKQLVYTNKLVHNWIPTIEGTYGFAVRSVDKAGNKSPWALSNTNEISLNDSCKITYDSTKPTTPQIYGFKNPDLSCGVVTSSGIVTVDWSDSEDVSKVGYNYQIDYPKPDGTRGIWNNYFTASEYRGSLNEGTHYIKVQAKDAAGNLSGWSEICEITKDTIAPVVDITSHNDGDILSGKETIFGEIIEDNISHYNLSLYKDEDGLCNKESTWNFKNRVWQKQVNGNNAVEQILDTTKFDNGHYMIRLAARDLAGNRDPMSDTGDGDSVEVICVAIDNEKPLGSIDHVYYQPVDYLSTKFVTNDNQPIIRGTYSDNNDVISVEVEIEGVEGPFSATMNSGEWSYQPSSLISDGTYNIRVIITDMADNELVVEKEITIDTVAPTATHTYYKNEVEITGGKTFVQSIDQLAFKAEYLDADPSSGLFKDIFVVFRKSDGKAYCSWSKSIVPEWPVNLSGESFSLSSFQSLTQCVSSLEDGEYYTRHRVYDNATRKTAPTYNQHRQYNGISFVVDSVDPESTITFPENSKSGDTVYLTQWNGEILGTAEDESSGLEKVELEIQRDSDSNYWNGADEVWQTDSYLNLTSSTDEFADWNFSFTPEADEIYYLTSHATDKAGNFEESYSIKVVFDKTIPNVKLTIDPTNPDGSGSWYITRPTLTMEAKDPSNSGLDNLQYQWNSQSESGWTTVSANGINSAIASTQPPKEGHSILYYRATDMAGNTFSETGVKNIYWDATELTEGPLDVKADPNPTSGSTSTISWTKAEDDIGIAKYKVTWDLNDSDESNSKEVSGNTTELKITDLNEGTYKVTVTAYDHSGHKKSASTNLVVNRTAPAAPTLTLVGTTAGTATLSWNEVEGANDYIILYGTESGNYQYAARVGNVTQYTVEGLTAGSYFFVVRAVDNVNNQSGNSNEVNTGAILGAVGAVAGPAAGFVEAGDVLGDQTDQEPTEEEMERAKAEAEKGAVLGEMDSCTSLKNLLPWIILGLQLVILLGVEIVMKRDSSAVKMVIALGTTIVAIALYYLLRNNACYADGSLTMIIDRFFWLASGLLSVVIRFLGYGFIEVVDKE